MIVTDDSLTFINSSIETRVSDHLITYENSVLEKKYPEFRYLMSEFHDGILLFEISEKKVWNRVSDDTVGLLRYYENNKKDFLTRQSIDTKIYTLRSPDGEKALSSAYKKYKKKPQTDDLLARKFNKNNDTLLFINEKKWFRGEDPEIDRLDWVAGMQSFSKGGYPSIILINSVTEPVPLSFDEIQGEMMKGYQDYLESEWIGQLKENYSVKIDNLVLNEVKKKLNNE
jgi:peptidyl-prolyl cis-trans isomerase SurA